MASYAGFWVTRYAAYLIPSSPSFPLSSHVCLTVKPVGEADALIGHVRFDEQGWETERCRMAQATAPILNSTFCDIARR